MRVSTCFQIAAALAAGILAGGCGSTLGPPQATSENVVDTVTLYAASGTPVGSPSAYDVFGGVRVRTDVTPVFDFLFDMTDSGAKLYPPGALPGLARTGALQLGGAFDAITSAPTGGWNDSSAIGVIPGTVVLARSRAVNCGYAFLSVYAKLEVLALDTLSRSISFQILSDINCGYRDLTPGIPKH